MNSCFDKNNRTNPKIDKTLEIKNIPIVKNPKRLNRIAIPHLIFFNASIPLTITSIEITISIEPIMVNNNLILSEEIKMFKFSKFCLKNNSTLFF